MFGRYKFHVGQRVRPSADGIAAGLFRKAREQEGGIVTKVDEFNCPTVLWDWRKTASNYHADFVMPDRRLRKA